MCHPAVQLDHGGPTQVSHIAVSSAQCRAFGGIADAPGQAVGALDVAKISAFQRRLCALFDVGQNLRDQQPVRMP